MKEPKNKEQAIILIAELFNKFHLEMQDFVDLANKMRDKMEKELK